MHSANITSNFYKAVLGELRIDYNQYEKVVGGFLEEEDFFRGWVEVSSSRDEYLDKVWR